jgi:3-hydroxyisobutyrate dehydrogenase-like beta-hydroxyacid dehydrogenase
MLKDLKLASSLSDSTGVPSPMLGLAKSMFQAGFNQGYGDEDLSAVVKSTKNGSARRSAARLTRNNKLYSI